MRVAGFTGAVHDSGSDPSVGGAGSEAACCPHRAGGILEFRSASLRIPLLDRQTYMT